MLHKINETWLDFEQKALVCILNSKWGLKCMRKSDVKQESTLKGLFHSKHEIVRYLSWPFLFVYNSSLLLSGETVWMHYIILGKSKTIFCRLQTPSMLMLASSCHLNVTPTIFCTTTHCTHLSFFSSFLLMRQTSCPWFSTVKMHWLCTFLCKKYW